MFFFLIEIKDRFLSFGLTLNKRKNLQWPYLQLFSWLLYCGHVLRSWNYFFEPFWNPLFFTDPSYVDRTLFYTGNVHQIHWMMLYNHSLYKTWWVKIAVYFISIYKHILRTNSSVNMQTCWRSRFQIVFRNRNHIPVFTVNNNANKFNTS